MSYTDPREWDESPEDNVSFDPKTKQIQGEIEFIPPGTSERIMNRIIFGNPEGDPFKDPRPKIDLATDDPVWKGNNTLPKGVKPNEAY